MFRPWWDTTPIYDANLFLPFKVCTGCGEAKHPDEFGTKIDQKTKKHYPRSKCNTCRALESRRMPTRALSDLYPQQEQSA